jgi:hypothetical protein
MTPWGSQGRTVSPVAGPAEARKGFLRCLDVPDLAWGQSPKQVTAAVDKLLDDDYRAPLAAASPGGRKKELEARLALDRNGSKTYFFFIQDKLWKIIVEQRLGPQEPAGSDFATGGRQGREGAWGTGARADA